jgi:hypothetical protein
LNCEEFAFEVEADDKLVPLVEEENLLFVGRIVKTDL